MCSRWYVTVHTILSFNFCCCACCSLLSRLMSTLYTIVFIQLLLLRMLLFIIETDVYVIYDCFHSTSSCCAHAANIIDRMTRCSIDVVQTYLHQDYPMDAIMPIYLTLPDNFAWSIISHSQISFRSAWRGSRILWGLFHASSSRWLYIYILEQSLIHVYSPRLRIRRTRTCGVL